jgi:hypothetical protein
MSPIPQRSASELANNIPSNAARDLVEWLPTSTSEDLFGMVVSHELSLDAIINRAPGLPAMQDDRAVNEYFLLRRLGDREFQRQVFHYVFF